MSRHFKHSTASACVGMKRRKYINVYNVTRIRCQWQIRNQNLSP